MVFNAISCLENLKTNYYIIAICAIIYPQMKTMNVILLYIYCHFVTVYDASAYYAGSILAGNNMRRGDAELCRELNEEININNYQTLVGINNRTLSDNVQSFMIPTNYLPFRVQLVNARYKTIIDSSPFHTYIIHQTACMPKSCNHNDLLQVMSYANVSHLRNNLVMKNSELLSLRILQESYSFFNDSAFFIFMLVSFFILN